jgi:hypothetical protein
MEIKDLTGLGSLGEKLVGEVSKAIGTVYRPRAIRNEAAARAEEIRLLGKAQAEVDSERLQIMAYVEAEKRALLALPDQELLERVRTRLLTREIQRQENIETVVDHALSSLPKTGSEAPLDPDWRTRFFNTIEDISDAQMQRIWGQVLAGEISKPGTWALRTLDILRQISREDAEVFKRVCGISGQGGMLFRIGSDTGEFVEFGITYGQILSLCAIGLIHESPMLTWNPKTIDNAILIGHSGLVFRLKHNDANKTTHSFPIYKLTVAGEQLQNLNQASPNMGYLTKLANRWAHLGYIVELGHPTTSEEGRTFLQFRPFPEAS